jgi:hypothetical protein
MLSDKAKNYMRTRWNIAIATSLVNIPDPTPYTNACTIKRENFLFSVFLVARKYANSILKADPHSSIGQLVKLQILLRSNPNDPNYVWEDHEKKVYAMFDILERLMTKFEAKLWRAYAFRELGSLGKSLKKADSLGYYLKAAQLYEELNKEHPDRFDIKRNASNSRFCAFCVINSSCMVWNRRCSKCDIVF